MKKIMLKAALCIAATAIFATHAVAATGSDISSNYVSNGQPDWANGTTGGTGFGPWTFYASSHGGASAFTGLEVDNNGTGDANIVAADDSVFKLYAVEFDSGSNPWEEAIAYRTFNTSLSTSGDGFAISLETQNGNNGIGTPGQVGFALRNGNTTGSGNQAAGARLQVYLAAVTNYAAGGSNYVVVADASGPRATTVTNLGPGTCLDFAVTLTGPNTYSLSITQYIGLGITAPPVTVTGTLAGSGTIDSFSVFSWTQESDPGVTGVNSDTYFNRLSYTNQAAFTCPTIVLGSLESPLQGAAYSQTITASGGLAPYSFALAGGSLPSGMSLSASGTLSGTPTHTGVYTFTVTTIDADSCPGSRSYTLTVYGTGEDNSANYGLNWNSGSGEGVGFGVWSVYYNYHGEGFSGYGAVDAGVNVTASDGSVWKLYAIDFNGNLQQEEATAYRRLTNPLSVAGDAFSMSFENSGGIGNPGQVGFSLRNGNINGPNSTTQDGSNNRNAHARLEVYSTGGAANLTVVDASGANEIPGVGFTTEGYDANVTLTGPNTYSLSITRYNGLGTFDAPAVVTGTLAGSGPIDSFAMYSWKNSTDSGLNGDAYFNNLAYTANTPPITNNVTFQVDMTVQILVGNFQPGTDTVEVQGSFNDWATGAYMLTNNPSLSGNASNIYSGVVPIVGAANSGESYKFVYNTGSGAVFEDSNPKSSTLDDGPDAYNRFLQLPNATATVLPSVLFNDYEADDYLPSATAVAFRVNMNGAVGTDGHTYGEGDTVWINGDFVPWYPWYNPESPLAGPAQYQMTETGPGSGIFTNTLVLPRSTTVAFAYKYGMGIATNGDLGPRDDEAPDGQNHYRVVRSTATGSYTMPQDTFGNQYQEPFFNSSARNGAQLAVGVPTAGRVPVTWLGRPGAHLQAATSLIGPWTDHFETDGTNWSAGYSSTNGLVSQTNWPTAGDAFFRLVKP